MSDPLTVIGEPVPEPTTAEVWLWLTQYAPGGGVHASVWDSRARALDYPPLYDPERPEKARALFRVELPLSELRQIVPAPPEAGS